MPMTLRTHMLLLLVALSAQICAVDETELGIRFLVEPGDVYGAMGSVTLQHPTKRVEVEARDPWYISSATATAKGNPGVMFLADDPEREIECPETGGHKIYRWHAVSQYVNTDMHIVINGVLTTCKPGAGTPPTFTATVCHADLDVDSDNSDFHGAPSKPEQNEAEETQEEGDIGLYILRNHGYEEGGKIPGLPAEEGGHPDYTKVQDYEIHGIVASDPDLPRAVVQISGRPGPVTFTFDANIRVWRESDLSEVGKVAPLILPVGPTAFRIEGIEPGPGMLSISYLPSGGIGEPVVDTIAYTVIDISMRTLHLPNSYAAGENQVTEGPEATKFPYTIASGTSRIWILSGATITPSLPPAEAQKLFGSGKLSFSVAPIDDSHAARDRVDLTWKRPSGGNPSIGVIDFAAAKEYQSGKVMTWARFTRLPADNSDFGNKQMTMRLGDRDLDVKPWQAYFRPLQITHHDAQGITANANGSANWYYYWSQQRHGTRDAVCEYAYDGENPTILWDEGKNIPNQALVPFGLTQVPEITLYQAIGQHTDGLPAATVEKAFNKGKAMGGSKRSNVIVSWSCQTAPDLANITFTHEYAHYLMATTRAEFDDIDQDGVPDEWEDALGMYYNARKPNGVIDDSRNENSFNFDKGSVGSSASRDNEFYCWVGAAFAGFGTYTLIHYDDQTKEYSDPVVLGADRYLGPKPRPANNSEDWSVGGTQWKIAP